MMSGYQCMQDELNMHTYIPSASLFTHFLFRPAGINANIITRPPLSTP